MSWWNSGVSVAELDPALGLGELSQVDGPVPRGPSEPLPITVPYDPTRAASERAGDLAGCPSGYGVIYATPEYGDTLYTRKCRAVEATDAADILRETRTPGTVPGLGDGIRAWWNWRPLDAVSDLTITAPGSDNCAALDLGCHLRGARPYLIGGAVLIGLGYVAYIVRAFR